MISEISKDKLRLLADDELTLNAINEIFCERIDLANPKIEKTDDDVVLGQRFRAYKNSKKILEDTLNSIKTYKEYKKNNVSFEKAR